MHFTELDTLSVSELLRLHAGILEQLRLRDIVRSANNPSGDFAETLFSRAFGWKLESNSSSGYDAIDASNTRYQIKCRRMTAKNTSRQMSALRNLKNSPFDILAVVLFDEHFGIIRGALIPIAIVIENSKFTEHVNAHRFMLRDSIWSIEGVVDVTKVLRGAQQLI
jgi:hypothetical protein